MIPILPCAGKARSNSKEAFSEGPFQIVVPGLADQRELTDKISMWTENVVWKT